MAAAAQKALTPTAWDLAALQAFTPALAINPWGPLAGLQDVFTGADLYDYANGKQHALVAVRPLNLAQGRRLDVVGLVSDGERLANEPFQAALLQLAKGYGSELLAMCTPHPHLVKQCARAGWFTSGAVMLKAVHGQ